MSNPDRCVCCGVVIPEGRMVCIDCERKVKSFTLVHCKACHHRRCGRCTNPKGLYRRTKPDEHCPYGEVSE